MARAIELIGIGMAPEEANREGDLGPGYLTNSASSVQSTCTTIGGPNGYTLLELAGSAQAAASWTFQANTEIDRYYTIYSTGTTQTIFAPTSTSGSFQTGGTSFAIGSGKTAQVVRLGPIPFPTGSIASDRWIYVLSN